LKGEAMQEIEFIKSVQALEVKEGDVLVVKVDALLSRDQTQRIVKEVENNLPIGIKCKVTVFVLERGADIGVLRAT